jgi:hypothetical protein
VLVSVSALLGSGCCVLRMHGLSVSAVRAFVSGCILDPPGFCGPPHGTEGLVSTSESDVRIVRLDVMVLAEDAEAMAMDMAFNLYPALAQRRMGHISVRVLDPEEDATGPMSPQFWSQDPPPDFYPSDRQPDTHNSYSLLSENGTTCCRERRRLYVSRGFYRGRLPGLWVWWPFHRRIQTSRGELWHGDLDRTARPQPSSSSCLRLCLS